VSELDPAREFYVGWQATSPPGHARRSRGVALAFLTLAVVLGVVIAAAQGTFLPSVFEFGTVRELHGVVTTNPHPALRVPRPGVEAGWSRYLLVAPGKHGADELVAGLEGHRASLRGTLVHHGGRTMIEVVPGSLVDAGPADDVAVSVDLGQHTLRGEVADSKCHLGVMNPGRSKVHRACAALCIRGGIPPVLLVDGADGSITRVLLVAADGSAVGAELLPLVADRVEVTGRLTRDDDLLVLHADPSAYRRLPD
jgi:hypothetical protein